MPRRAAARAPRNGPAPLRSALRLLSRDSASGSLSRSAFETIRAAIVHGRFDFGEPLSETELAGALGISKGPVRTALRELQINGLVEIVPQSATYVFRASREQIRELGDFRLVLESEAIRLAVEHAAPALLADLRRIIGLMSRAAASANRMQTKLLDTQFHQTFILHSGNSYLVSSYDTIVQLVDALRYRVLDTIVYRNRAFEEHKRMVAFLERGKVSAAISVLRKHIERTKQFHGSVDWGHGRARRKDYRFRNYREALER